ncbi:hypothetical protein AAD001_14495 [Colwelliaceae bacterium 6471]
MMVYLKGKWALHRQFITFVVLMICSLAASSQSNVVDNKTVEHNIRQVDYYFSMDNESLPHNEVVRLSSEIIQTRQFYTSNIIAKVYVLLAETAKSKGDMARAFQFARDGLSLSGVDKAIRINLLLEVAAGYYAKGKYHDVLANVEQVIILAEKQQNIKCRLIGLSYRAMAYALIAEHENAVHDLKVVEQLISENPEFSDHLVLLDILATAHHYLGDYQTAITLYHKLLKLHITLAKQRSIASTYYKLAQSYLRLKKLDDAYHAFWEAKQYAEQNKAPIRIAYAQLGLGEVLLLQNEYEPSYRFLLNAKKLFQGQNLMQPYLSTLIALSKVSLNIGKQAFAYQLLKQAEGLADSIELTREQIELYQLLSRMYEEQKDHQKSLRLLNTYVELKHQFTIDVDVHNSAFAGDKSANTQSKQLAVKLAESSELRAKFSQKFKRQQQIMLLLFIIVIMLLVLLIWIWLVKRTRKMNRAYDEIEKPAHLIANPEQTKQIYQLEYKKARKYEYPLAVGYLSIDNWTELNFRFNAKVVNEVTKTISTLLNENIGEFDFGGLLNSGEYLLLSPHGSNAHMKQRLTNLSNALAVRFFANLGEFSVKVRYSYGTPSAQDIDPYIFLSRLTTLESNK